jgi:hypothetical protein
MLRKINCVHMNPRRTGRRSDRQPALLPEVIAADEAVFEEPERLIDGRGRRSNHSAGLLLFYSEVALVYGAQKEN